MWQAHFLLIQGSRDPHASSLPLFILLLCEEEHCFHGNDHQRFLASLSTLLSKSASVPARAYGACGDSEGLLHNFPKLPSPRA